MKPLVSILIPAYNSEEWIADTIRSALAQVWPRKEIIVVDDGSRDRTMEVARAFASSNVHVVKQQNQGAAAARNKAYSLCQGDYIQWLDADDLIAPDKIARQMSEAERCHPRDLLSSGWAYFVYRTAKARFVPTPLWENLAPVEFLLRKMGQDQHMQTGTWLVSRELTEAAGPWDIRLSLDDDGEYFCRVLLASRGTRFVTGTGIYYRQSGSSSLSFVGNSDKKKNSLLRSIKLHIQYIRSLEESERVRKACLAYLQKYYEYFYPDKTDVVRELQGLATQLQGQLEEPRLRWKYAWMQKVWGFETARQAQLHLPQFKARLVRCWDKTLFHWERSIKAKQNYDSTFAS